MTTPRRLLPFLLLPVALLARAVENFPPPEFTGGYQYPPDTWPGPRVELFAYVDIAVLMLTLALAGYFALRLRSRRHLLVVMIFSLLYFGFYRHGCVCTVGAIQNVALTLGQPGYALPLAVGAFFLLPLLVALFAGRIFCAGVCPLGAMQDIMLHRPLRVPAWLQRALGLLPFIFLGLAVLFAATGSLFLICKFDPFVPFFRLNGPPSMFIAGAAMLLLSMVVGRPYCRFACPYSALLRLVSPLAKWRTAITPGSCVQCHLCADACPFGAILPPTPPPDGKRHGEGRGRLAVMLILLPVLIAGGAWLGSRNSEMLARVHPTVQRAETAWKAERDTLQPDVPSENVLLYRQAITIRTQYAVGAPLLGGWIGLVLGVQLVALCVRRKRKEYAIDQAACMSCARCYASCPVQQAREADPEREIEVVR